MKVVFLTDEYGEASGGIGRAVAALASASVALGHEATVVYVEEDDGPTRADDRLGVIHLHVESSNRFADRAVLKGKAVRTVYEQLRRQRRADLVVAPVWNTLAIGIVDDLEAPLISTVVTPLEVAGGFHGVANTHPDVVDQVRRETRLLRESPVLHFLSDHVRRTTESLVANRKGTFFVAPVPSGLHPNGPCTLPLVQRDGAKRLLYVGRLEPRKGIDVLLAALDRLHASHQGGLRLDVVGDTSPRRAGGISAIDELEQRFHDREWWSTVRFHGIVGDSRLRELYEGCDAVCIPSLYESQGLVGVEALQFGRPLIATATGNLQSLVDGNGWMVAPGDVLALSRALSEFCSMRSLVPMSERSFALAQQFNATVLTDAFLATAVEALSSVGRPVVPE